MFASTGISGNTFTFYLSGASGTATSAGTSNPLTDTFTWAYDLDGRQTSVAEISGSGSTLSYEADTYDAQGDLTGTDNNGLTAGLPHITTTGTYDSSGRRTGFSLAKGTTLTTDFANTYGYDVLNRMTSITQSGSGVANKYVSLGYDTTSRVNGLIEAQTSTSGLTLTSTYSYQFGNQPIFLQYQGIDSSGCPRVSLDIEMGAIQDADGRTTFGYQNNSWDSYGGDGYSGTYTYDNDGQLTGTAYGIKPF